MTDLKTIAAECATRIMDRMEMCRGSAILKGDIEREVEMALAQVAAATEPKVRWFLVDDTLTETVPAEPEPQSLIGKALSALGDQAFEEPDMAFVNKDAYEALGKQLQDFSSRAPQSFWGTQREAYLGLSEADRAQAQHEYLMFGQAVVFTDEDGNSKFVPMREFSIDIAEHVAANEGTGG